MLVSHRETIFFFGTNDIGSGMLREYPRQMFCLHLKGLIGNEQHHFQLSHRPNESTSSDTAYGDQKSIISRQCFSNNDAISQTVSSKTEIELDHSCLGFCSLALGRKVPFDPLS